MVSYAFITNSDEATTILNVSLGGLITNMNIAVQRAQIILGYAVNLTSGEPLESIKLSNFHRLDCGIEDPINEESREPFQQNFRRWVISQCLLELDQSFQRYLEDSIHTKSDMRYYPFNNCLDPKKPKIFNKSSSDLLRIIFKIKDSVKEGEEENIYTYGIRISNCLSSLVNARNCLAHDSGVVNERRLKGEDGDIMTVRWPAKDFYLTRKNGDPTLISRDAGYVIRKEDLEEDTDQNFHERIIEKDVMREQRYRIGDTIVFSSTDLDEIIIFYYEMARVVLDHLKLLCECASGFEIKVLGLES